MFPWNFLRADGEQSLIRCVISSVITSNKLELDLLSVPKDFEHCDIQKKKKEEEKKNT